MRKPFVHHAVCSLAVAGLLHATPWGWAQEPPGAPPDAPAAPGTMAEPSPAPAGPTAVVPPPAVEAPPTAAAVPAVAAAEPPEPAAKVTLNFRNAPVDAVLDHLSKAAGFVIVKDVPVSGTVDVWSHQPLDPDEAVELLNTVLARQNLAAIRSERILRIVSRDAALRADLPVEHGADPDAMSRSDAMATQIIPVKHADAAKIVDNLKPLLGDKAQLSANASSNSLILTDTRTNIRRMTMIVKALDSSISSITEIRVFPLEDAEAKDIADVINKVFEEPQTQTQGRSGPMEFFRRMRGGGPPGMGGEGGATESGTSEAKTATSKVTAVGDERSNCVVVSASSDIMPQIATLVKQVDVPTQDDAIVEVYALKYADAEDAVEVLEKIYAESNNSAAQNIPGSRRSGMFGGFGGGPGMMMRGGNTNTGSNSRSLGQADVSVVADTRTNSVVVSASASTMAAIAKVIAKLDETPKNVTQIYIYRIENADLENIKEILEGMFDDIEDTGTTTSLAPSGGQAGSTRTGTVRRN